MQRDFVLINKVFINFDQYLHYLVLEILLVIQGMQHLESIRQEGDYLEQRFLKFQFR